MENGEAAGLDLERHVGRGVSALTIYNWEMGKSRSRAMQLDEWLAVNGIGKRKAWKRLGY